jgi:hypothetical protein
MIMICSRRLLLATTSLLLACAGTQRAGEGAPPRLKDSAPEKTAAQRAASPGLALEAEDARWGVTAAAERKRAQDDRRAKAEAAFTGPGRSRVDVAPLPPAPVRTP